MSGLGVSCSRGCPAPGHELDAEILFIWFKSQTLHRNISSVFVRDFHVVLLTDKTVLKSWQEFLPSTELKLNRLQTKFASRNRRPDGVINCVSGNEFGRLDSINLLLNTLRKPHQAGPGWHSSMKLHHRHLPRMAPGPCQHWQLCLDSKCERKPAWQCAPFK